MQSHVYSERFESRSCSINPIVLEVWKWISSPKWIGDYILSMDDEMKKKLSAGLRFIEHLTMQIFIHSAKIVQ